MKSKYLIELSEEVINKHHNNSVLKYKEKNNEYIKSLIEIRNKLIVAGVDTSDHLFDEIKRLRELYEKETNIKNEAVFGSLLKYDIFEKIDGEIVNSQDLELFHIINIYPKNYYFYKIKNPIIPIGIVK